MLKRVHHINFVVRDLETAVSKYQSILGLQECELSEHPHRPVKTARFKVGESWIVLVQPLDEDSPPARHLQQHGEGFFLISYEVDDIDEAIRQVTESGGKLTDPQSRPGILNWQVADIDAETFNNVIVQLTEEKSKK